MGKVSFLTNGTTTLEGLSRAVTAGLTETGVVGDNDLLVSQSASPGKSVAVAVGSLYLSANDPEDEPTNYALFGWAPTAETVTITDNSSGNARIDAIVAWIDSTAAGSSDNNGALKFAAIAGTPGASPVAPTTSAISSALGAGVPWLLLAHVEVANGFSSIVDANVTDMRPVASTVPRLAADLISDFVASGLVFSQSSGLIGTMTRGRAYIGGRLVSKSKLIAHTFTASKDTYVDLPVTAAHDGDDDLTYTEVANGATSPSLASGSIRIAKIVTNGSAITSSVTYGYDGISNPIRNTDPFSSQSGTKRGWLPFGETVTCGSNNVITASASFVSRLSVGDKIWLLDDGTAWMGYVVSKPTSTTFGILGGTTAGAAATVASSSTITAPYYSKIDNPTGFPHQFDYDANPQGFSSVQFGTLSFSIRSRMLTLHNSLASSDLRGTSNATTFTFTLPVPPLIGFYSPVFVADNSSTQTTPGTVLLAAGSTTATVYKTFFNGAFTASGAKTAYINCITYPI